jgi:hypothetical protein
MAAEKPAKVEPLAIRLYFQPCLYELARVVGYDGIPEAELDAKLKTLRETHQEEVAKALQELTEKDEERGLIVLKPAVRWLCRQLLGYPPEYSEHERRWEKGRPPDLYPPPMLRAAPDTPQRGRRKKQGSAGSGNAPDTGGPSSPPGVTP